MDRQLPHQSKKVYWQPSVPHLWCWWTGGFHLKGLRNLCWLWTTMSSHTVLELKQLLSCSPASHVSIIHFNARSLLKNFDDMVNFLTLTDHHFSLICLSETWLSAADNNMFSIPGYRAEFFHRRGDCHGGSAIFTSNTLSYRRRTDIAFSVPKCESVWLEFDRDFLPSNKRTIIGSIYRSPWSSYGDFCLELDEILSSFSEDSNLLLPKVNTNCGKMTALFSAISFWNSLPLVIKSSPSLHCFRRNLKHFLLTTCAT